MLDYLSQTPVKFIVSFSNDLNWLPSNVDIKYIDDVQFCFEFADWKLVDDVSIPHSVDIRHPDRSAPVFFSLTFEVVETCPKNDVFERCTMSFYDLPDDILPIEPKGYWTYAIYGLVAVVCDAVGWFTIQRRGQA